MYSDSNMTTDNAYRNLDATVHSQHGTVRNESNLQSQGYLSAVLHIYLSVSNLNTSLSLNTIIVLVILYSKLRCALLA